MNPKPKILIVDDEPLNVKLLRAMLPVEKYICVLAYSGKTALEKAAEESPDLILLDVMMPVTDGFEVTKLLKSDPDLRDIPVILITAMVGDEYKIKGLEAGADEFLNKPINKAELLARIQSLLRLKQFKDQFVPDKDSRNLVVSDFGNDRPLQKTINLPSILIVEDNEKDSRLIQGYLHGEPYHIMSASKGEEAISRAQQEKIDLILLDLLLPGMDGFTVCRSLKKGKLTKHIQIVVITSLQDLDSKIRGIELGADDYLVKPINRHELRVRVKTLIKKKAYLDSLHANYEIAVNSAITDKLTGLYNQGYFKHFLDFEIKRTFRQKSPVSLLMIDVDDFRQCNDKLGHHIGDQILRELGRQIKENVREIDLAVRYGGEKFAVVLSNTGIRQAVDIAERLRNLVRNHPFFERNSIPANNLSVSIGVGSYVGQYESVDEFVQETESALYRAKLEGKDRVCQCYESSIKKISL